MTSLVRDLFDVPERVHQGDFVLKLTEGLQNPEETAALYVATPALVEAFDRALGLVGDTIKTGRSKAAYLHGSFGSGKSHFMAMLSLLLRGHEAAWRLPELHALRARHAFCGQAKLLELHFHMIGAESLEQKLFGTYVDTVRTQHPDADLPSLFADEELFQNARHLLSELGDERFFAALGGQKAGWGKLGAGWNRERFEHAVNATDPKERGKLFSALAKSQWFSAYTQQGVYVDVDSGLEVMARHASDLGYQGLVFFLDELILWLSHRATEAAWLHNETQKMVKLVEAQESARAIPIASFIARQRSLDEMVGKLHSGMEVQLLNDSLDHWKGRFDTIQLEDKNLPAIVERRILRPKGEAEKQELGRAFHDLEKSAAKSWQTLLGSEDRAAFQKLYPFSPALVDALVALSNTLQRQRTAIKLLVELLSEHIRDLKVGEVVCVGDLFDVLAGADDPADGVMRARFKSAKDIYSQQFLPLLQEIHQTNTKERCQRLRDDHPVRLGCSNCPEKPCRADNRLVKTLLIAALVPEVKVFKELTVSRLYQLNHGSLKTAVPGMEVALIGQKLKEWGASNLPVTLSADKDPLVQLRLEGVDLKPILDRYRGEDSPGARQRVLRDLLFEALGLDALNEAREKQEKLTWRGTSRVGTIVFGNVRSFSDEALRCRDEHDFRLVIDYPFDDPGKSPNDDLRVAETFKDSGGSWTLVWLPHFFTESVKQLLGELVILEHLLGSQDVKRQAVSHLSLENQGRALSDLDNLRHQKRVRLLEVMEEAYGLKQKNDTDIDPACTVDEPLIITKPGAPPVRPALAANLASAKEAFVTALLECRYPRHPLFSHALSTQRVEKLVHLFAELVASERSSIPAEREAHSEAMGTLGVLGLVRGSEGALHLVDDRLLQDLEKRRLQESSARPTVDEIKGFIDRNHALGLQRQAEDLIVRCYALWAKRTFELHGKAFQPLPGKALPGDACLEQPDLPERTEWQAGVDQANRCLGVSLPGHHYLSPDNLMKLHASIEARLAQVAAGAAALPSLLERRALVLRLAGDFDRLQTARSADALCAALRGQPAAEQIRRLAQFDPRTSATAIGREVTQVRELRALLENDLVFGVFEQLAALGESMVGATELWEQAAAAVRQDETNVALVARLQDLANQGQRLLAPKPGEAAAPSALSASSGGAVVSEQWATTEATEARARWQALNGRIENELAKASEFELRVSVQLTRKA